MRPAVEVIAPLMGQSGPTGVALRVAVLPKNADGVPVLWDPGEAADSDDASAALDVVEGHEYRYEWLGLDASLGAVNADPDELFQPDTTIGRSGRLRPGLATGTVQVALRSGDVPLGRLEIEVRSRKLSYRSEYQWMLSDIAQHMSELVMDRFAASQARFESDESRDAVTLYQRFAFLRSLLEGEAFQFAIREVLRRPHTAWDMHSEWVRPGAGLRADSSMVRQLSRAGPRVAWDGGTIASVPALLERRRTEATHDTTPNRFVKFALEHWRQVLGDIDRGLAQTPASPATLRGRREVAAVISKLDEVLHQELFLDLRPMARFPADDQVLHKRECYRDIFKAYVEFELAARLSWQPSDEAYGGGQRDVSTLYEYWAFIQLAQITATLLGQSFDMSPLLKVNRDGLNVVLQTGKETVLKGNVERLGRRMAIELCFNRTYGPESSGSRSWTRRMRPDYSLLISSSPIEPAGFEPIVLHFDAKYRVDFIEELFGTEGEAADGVLEDDEESLAPKLKRGGARRADLLKMHAYRDAIRRTAGAYVLYPGGDAELGRTQFTEYHELLPGLGAFVLRPASHGPASGEHALRKFIDDVLDHVATRLTDHERGRYWLQEVYGSASRKAPRADVEVIPPKTSVLVGYVKSREHWAWIRRRKAYNVRTESRTGGVGPNAALLQSQLLLLYCPSAAKVALARIVSEAELVSREGMAATGYPLASSDYWCVQLSWIDRPDWTSALSASALDGLVQQLGHPRGAPIRVAWSQLPTTGFAG